MSKFACTCGKVISDVHCPNEVTGWLLSDKSGEAFFNTISHTIDEYLRHAANDDVPTWRDKHFNGNYPSDVSAGDMIHDVLTEMFFDRTLGLMECDECGRIWVQKKPNVNAYQGYRPDADSQTRMKVLGFNIAAPIE